MFSISGDDICVSIVRVLTEFGGSRLVKGVNKEF